MNIGLRRVIEGGKGEWEGKAEWEKAQGTGGEGPIYLLQHMSKGKRNGPNWEKSAERRG